MSKAENYNIQYRSRQNVFGLEPENTLVQFVNQIESDLPILDIGAGQGRNSFFLAQQGFRVTALDPSKVAIETIRQAKVRTKYPVLTHVGDFETFIADDHSFGAILLFGLLQILSWEEINRLITKLEKWIQTDGLLFITAFSSSDPSYSRYSSKWKQVAAHSYSNEKSEVRTFLEPNQILKIIPHKEVLHHWEGIGPWHHHGNEILEQHAMIEAVFRL